MEIIKEEAYPEKVILFGSRAKGTWVENHYIVDGTRYSYISDYDFLVVTHNSEFEEHDIASRITNRWKVLSRIVSPIVHDIDYINAGLRIGQYFSTDIINEGVLLYDTRDQEFIEVAKLTTKEEKEKAQDHCDIWYPQASQFLIYAINAFERGAEGSRNRSFYLYQATECFYSAAF